MYGWTKGPVNYGQIDRQINKDMRDRQRVRQTESDRDREADRETETERHKHTQTSNNILLKYLTVYYQHTHCLPTHLWRSFITMVV